MGETVAESRLGTEAVSTLNEIGALTPIIRGSRRSYKAANAENFRSAVELAFGIRDIDAHLTLITNSDSMRADATRITGDSKAQKVRTFCGFLVNSYTPIEAELSGMPFTIAPQEGSYVFVSDFMTFHIPNDVIVVGIENSENFRYIRRQRRFFEQEVAQCSPLLFVSRYPQRNNDLTSWLASIPNNYIHFGDLDLAGVSIFLTEFYAKLGPRASFLIPSDYIKRLQMGSEERYNVQLPHFRNMSLQDNRVLPLVSAIHDIHKGYDQEGYIGDSNK